MIIKFRKRLQNLIAALEKIPTFGIKTIMKIIKRLKLKKMCRKNLQEGQEAGKEREKLREDQKAEIEVEVGRVLEIRAQAIDGKKIENHLALTKESKEKDLIVGTRAKVLIKKRKDEKKVP